MNEQLNQVENTESTELEFDLSDLTDDGNETTEDVQKPAEEQQDVASTNVEKKAEDDAFLDVVYNGEKKNVSKEEAIALAQKGMNYDKIVNQLNEVRNSPELQMLQSIAEANGLSPTEYLTHLQEFQTQSKVNSVYQQLKEKYPETSDEMLQNYAASVVNQQMQADKSKQSALEMREQHEREERAMHDLETFQQAYPDVDIRNLPTEVIKGIQSGESLLSAYRGYEIEQIRKENETLKLNNKNKDVSVGSLSASQTSIDEEDPFLAGLMSK